MACNCGGNFVDTKKKGFGDIKEKKKEKKYKDKSKKDKSKKDKSNKSQPYGINLFNKLFG